MPVKLSELVNDLRWIQIPVGDEELNIAYRPNAISIQMVASLESLSNGNIESLASVLVILIADWDLMDDDNDKIPITAETFRALPFPLVQLIVETLTDSMGTEKKAPNGTYAAGLPPLAKLANAPTGIQSSEPHDTWA